MGAILTAWEGTYFHGNREDEKNPEVLFNWS